VVAWQLLVFSTPARHPRMSPAERDYISGAITSEMLYGQDYRRPFVTILAAGVSRIAVLLCT
jgi:hypothetical protein